MFNLHSHFVSENSIYNAYLTSFKEPTGWFSLGIHPWYISSNWKSLLLNFVFCKDVVAIGECGLDRVCETDFELQKEVFQAQIDLAEKLNKPLIIHCVKAHNDCELLLRNVQVPVIFHGFNAKYTVLKQLLKHEHFYFSFGKATFNSSLKATIDNCPLDKMFIETDDSQLAIEVIYQKVAEIKEVSLPSLITQILLNRKKVFDL